MVGYNLTKQETKWVNLIKEKAEEDLIKRKITPNYNSVLTTAIFGVTLFTRKLKLIAKGRIA